MHELRPKFEEHGGTTVDWLELAAEGPGMQARAGNTPTDFFSDDPFARQDEADDGHFYEKPRLVQHFDAAARAVISRLHGELIRPGADVLDLMGSWVSHLPDGLPVCILTVLGMNREELAANSRATERVIHDLNLDPRLPLSDGRYDAVICTASVEYLMRPFEVFAEAARVLKPGGVLAQPCFPIAGFPLRLSGYGRCCTNSNVWEWFLNFSSKRASILVLKPFLCEDCRGRKMISTPVRFHMLTRFMLSGAARPEVLDEFA